MPANGAKMKLKKFDLAAAVLVMTIWGANFSVIGLGLHSIDPFTMTLLRSLFCAFPLVFFIKKPKNISYSTLAIYGILFGVGMGGGLNLAMNQGLSAGVSSVLLQFSAFFTIFLGYLFLKERVTKIHIAGIIFSSVGLFMSASSPGEQSTATGIALILFAAFSWALCNLIVKLTKPEDMFSFIIWSSLFSAPALLLITLIIKGTQPLQELHSSITWQGTLSILFQSYITTILGYMIWNNLIKKYPTCAIAPLSLIVPVAGIITSHLFLDERLSLAQGLAITCIFTGISIFINSGSISKYLIKRQGRKVTVL